MAAYFELVDAPEGGYRVRLINSIGHVVAVSVRFPTKRAATESIFQTMEAAANAPMRDLSAAIDGKHEKRHSETQATKNLEGFLHAYEVEASNNN